MKVESQFKLIRGTFLTTEIFHTAVFNTVPLDCIPYPSIDRSNDSFVNHTIISPYKTKHRKKIDSEHRIIMIPNWCFFRMLVHDASRQTDQTVNGGGDDAQTMPVSQCEKCSKPMVKERLQATQASDRFRNFSTHSRSNNFAKPV